MDRDVLMHQMEERFREGFAKALDALQHAPDGHRIFASEMAFRDAALTVAREGLELAFQAKTDAHPTAQAAGLGPDDWLAVIGLRERTRIAVTVRGPANPRFVISEDQFVDEWKKNSGSRKTGDGTVPLAGALPPFLPEQKLVCVCDKDFGVLELRDRALAGVAGLHGLLPAMNLVQRLVLKHFRPDFGGAVWGRRLPGVGATDWAPPIKKLKDKT